MSTVENTVRQMRPERVNKPASVHQSDDDDDDIEQSYSQESQKTLDARADSLAVDVSRNVEHLQITCRSTHMGDTCTCAGKISQNQVRSQL
jgi:hypothetical protein